MVDARARVAEELHAAHIGVNVSGVDDKACPLIIVETREQACRALRWEQRLSPAPHQGKPITCQKLNRLGGETMARSGNVSARYGVDREALGDKRGDVGKQGGRRRRAQPRLDHLEDCLRAHPDNGGRLGRQSTPRRLRLLGEHGGMVTITERGIELRLFQPQRVR